jgi:lipid-A-disaccharide synthase
VSAPLRIGLVAGEASGDLLGAAFIQALRERVPNVQFVGLAGERMVAAGCEALGSSEELAVMGFVEPLRHLPRLIRLRSRLVREFQSRRIDAFVGIDAPAFNLGLAAKLKAQGFITAQYVSPQVWAWRQGRVKKIAAAVDAVMCLLPFETRFYAAHSVRAEFVGHPLADEIPVERDQLQARRMLGIDANAQVVALLPGSRVSEVQKLGADFAAAAVLLARQISPAPVFIAPMTSGRLAQIFSAQVKAAGAAVRILDKQADLALEAADATLVASGTATLQTMLHACPMVVAYRTAPLTAFLALKLGIVKVKYFSLPNLLADEMLVPEFLQEQVKPDGLAAALREALTNVTRREQLKLRFRDIHLQLRRSSAARAAQVVLELVEQVT